MLEVLVLLDHRRLVDVIVRGQVVVAGVLGQPAKIFQVVPADVHVEEHHVTFTDWNCRGGENNVIIRTDGTAGPSFPLYSATYDWGTIEQHKFDHAQLREMKKTCQKHCFSTLNHNPGYCYNDACVIKWLWCQAKRGFQSGTRSFED